MPISVSLPLVSAQEVFITVANHHDPKWERHLAVLATEIGHIYGATTYIRIYTVAQQNIRCTVCEPAGAAVRLEALLYEI